MRRIETLQQVQALIGETYMYAVIIGIVALVFAFIIAMLIKWQGGKNPRDHVKRRIWFIIVGIVFPIAFFLFNAFYVSSFISRPPLQAKFSTGNLIATLIVLGVYVGVGIITMLFMRNTKWGSILGKSKN